LASRQEAEPHQSQQHFPLEQWLKFHLQVEQGHRRRVEPPLAPMDEPVFPEEEGVRLLPAAVWRRKRKTKK
jgi:hypothetical protein